MNRSNSSKVERLKRYLADAATYEEWKEIAKELDRLELNTTWKNNIASDIYNYDMLLDRYKELRSCYDSKNIEALARALREGLHHDLGNMGDIRLYHQCYFGTKQLIEDYVDLVCDCIKLLAESPLKNATKREKLDFFRDILISFGRPALLLSGGASLGVFHLGVVKALWERDLLPQVINGSSSGAIMAACLGTHSDDELPRLLDPAFHTSRAWKLQGIYQAFTGQGLMEQKQLEDYIRALVGEYSMQEAFEKTGRSINISVSPVQHHQKPRLLSGYTSPYITMWSAALASSAVPGIFPPVKLLKKNSEGEVVPHMPKLRWVDGSVVSDLPVERLMHLYDVNYTIVSQTNPHVVPFLETDLNIKKPKISSLPAKWLKTELKFHGKIVCDYMRKHSENELLRQVSGQFYSLMDQKYYGDVTIAPRYKLAQYLKVLSNPTPKFVEELMLQGERATWPKLSMIKTHAKISHTLEACIVKLKDDLGSAKGKLSAIA